jgi:hypothetical protein
MGLINNTTNKEQPVEPVNPASEEPEEKPSRHWIAPTLILILLLALIAGLVAGGYWVFIHKEELRERFFPKKPEISVIEPVKPQAVAPKPIKEVEPPKKEVEPPEKEVEPPKKEDSPSFFSKLIKKDRTINVKGTLLGEAGGAAALINEKMVPEGFMINGIRILEITDQSIVIESDGRKVRLQVGESFDPAEQ